VESASVNLAQYTGISGGNNTIDLRFVATLRPGPASWSRANLNLALQSTTFESKAHGDNVFHSPRTIQIPALPRILDPFLLFATAVLVVWGCSSSRADSTKPFDERWCFCNGWNFRDLSVGTLQFSPERQVSEFVVHTPLTDGPDGIPRSTGEVVDLRGLILTDHSGPFLLYDLTNHQGRWCLIPLQTYDLTVPSLVSNACRSIEFPSGTVPADCREEVPLSDIADFARALERGAECEETATRHLGIPGPAGGTGCQGGSPTTLATFLLLLVSIFSRLKPHRR
jgi:hypothetical protein